MFTLCAATAPFTLTPSRVICAAAEWSNVFSDEEELGSQSGALSSVLSDHAGLDAALELDEFDGIELTAFMGENESFTSRSAGSRAAQASPASAMEPEAPVPVTSCTACQSPVHSTPQRFEPQPQPQPPPAAEPQQKLDPRTDPVAQAQELV